MASLDEVLDLLSEKRRRHLFYYLDEQDGPVTVDDLVSYIARQDSFSTMKYVPFGLPSRIEIKLKHVDLPKSAETEFVRYDPTDGIVELTNPPPAFEEILTVAKELERG